MCCAVRPLQILWDGLWSEQRCERTWRMLIVHRISWSDLECRYYYVSGFVVLPDWWRRFPGDVQSERPLEEGGCSETPKIMSNEIIQIKFKLVLNTHIKQIVRLIILICYPEFVRLYVHVCLRWVCSSARSTPT